MVNTTRSSKRRRRVIPNNGHQISCLPDSILADVAAYLPKPSRAIFATALADPPPLSSSKSDWTRLPSATSTAIVSQAYGEDNGQFAVLDFGDIEKSLASKLSDDDIAGILMSINALINLKTLKLTGCINITGQGLKPLRGSTVIEQIDLSLVGQHDSPLLEPEPPILKVAVFPILQSIVRADGCLLKQLQLPKKFYTKKFSIVKSFFREYNQLIADRGYHCSGCDGIQVPSKSKTCYICTKYFCKRNGDCHHIHTCEHCEKAYCDSCFAVQYCPGCENGYCSECTLLKQCDQCHDYFCSADIKSNCPARVRDRLCCGGGKVCDDCDTYNICHNKECNKEHCYGCHDGKEYDVETCNVCRTEFCVDCRYAECSKDWEKSCPGCIHSLIPALQKGYQENEQRKPPDERVSTRASKCQKEHCSKKHCDDCCACEVDVLKCDNCDDCSMQGDESSCFNCLVGMLVLFGGDGLEACESCMNLVVPTLVKGYEENKMMA